MDCYYDSLFCCRNRKCCNSPTLFYQIRTMEKDTQRKAYHQEQKGFGNNNYCFCNNRNLVCIWWYFFGKIYSFRLPLSQNSSYRSSEFPNSEVVSVSICNARQRPSTIRRKPLSLPPKRKTAAMKATAFNWDCKPLYSALADCKSAGTGNDSNSQCYEKYRQITIL